MDLDGVRTFVAVADCGRFQDAAAELSVTQQAVSKRVAALERALGVRLLTRTPRGARLSIDGEAFLPYARELLRAEQRALAAVRPGARALRVDVVGRRYGPAAVLRGFHTRHPDAELDVVTLADAGTAVEALRAGTVDAAFRAVPAPGSRMPDGTAPGNRPPDGSALRHRPPDGIAAVPAFDEPIQLLTGPRHPLAGARAVTPADLAGHRLWMPGLVAGTESAAYYDAFAAAFGLVIEVSGPDFGAAPLLDTLAESGALATLVGAMTHLVWPPEHGLRRVPLRAPTPVYRHSLLHRAEDRHPVLAALRRYLADTHVPEADVWTPAWTSGTGDAREPA
ncbi:LysR family transcriptional regulator [Streptomyces sp. J2-1]|uniref:LysR family transcriptional regulator n=1 Tax=Streptomyces corallincola TaxID=2851888 RepID=UPI001C394329|nr:LysR family transcriptional regulator [Streptomyces corallincola]MBV2353937.1 LysR family transcriptional regulator [Streptomyces corallincola]